MNDLAALNARFNFPGRIAVVPGNGQLPKIVVTTQLASAEIYLHGAHVTGFQPAGHEPVLFVSKASKFAPGKAIRGGVPICFPWFGPLEGNSAAPSHGFARTAEWTVDHITVDDRGVAVVALSLTAGDKFDPNWPHAFAVTFTVTVGSELSMAMKVTNPRGEPFLFEQALHSYFAVGDIGHVAVTGLANTEFYDKVAKHRAPGVDAPIKFTQETDRVYLDTNAPCTIADASLKRSIVVAKRGSNTTVVWNPWAEKSKALPDLDDDDYRHFVCVESGNTGGQAVIVRPGETVEMAATVSVSNG